MLPEFVHRDAVVVLFACKCVRAARVAQMQQGPGGAKTNAPDARAARSCGKQAGRSGKQDSWDRRDSNAEKAWPGSYPQGRIKVPYLLSYCG
ncbi:hypothetical protein PT2222_10124 [Paraburkholderia tropica]